MHVPKYVPIKIKFTLTLGLLTNIKFDRLRGVRLCRWTLIPDVVDLIPIPGRLKAAFLYRVLRCKCVSSMYVIISLVLVRIS